MSSGSVNYRIQSLQNEIRLLKQVIFNNNQEIKKVLHGMSERIDKLEQQNQVERLVLIDKSSTNPHN